MPPSSAAYRMANRLAGDRLADVLAERRAAGESWEEVSRQVHETYGVIVTSETLRRWGAELGIDAAPVGESA